MRDVIRLMRNDKDFRWSLIATVGAFAAFYGIALLGALA